MQSGKTMSLCPPPRRLCLAFLLLHLLGQVAGTKHCDTPCPASCPEKPVCAPGVPVVRDSCWCCLVCARQRGESCSDLHPCQEGSGLFCDRSADPSNRTGICMAVEGDNCVFAGITYQSGVTFQPNCQFQCSCQDGQVTCVPRCKEDMIMPGPDCPFPRKVKVPGECCEKWVCDSNETFPDLLTLPAYKSEDTVKITISEPNTNCIEQITQWSPCSRTCGNGISSRISNDNEQCEMRKEIRHCIVRPCGLEIKPPKQKMVENIDKVCHPIIKAPKAIHLQFDNCTSVETYRPKYCGKCIDGRCCNPEVTRTVSAEFKCSKGERVKKLVMLIRECECDTNCPEDNPFIQLLKPNTHRRGV